MTPDEMLPALRSHLSVVPYRAPPPKITITKEQLGRHLMVMGVVFPPRNSMTEAELTLRFQIFYCDLRGLSERELALACERYRKDPENRFFPTPGQLLELAR